MVLQLFILVVVVKVRFKCVCVTTVKDHVPLFNWACERSSLTPGYSVHSDDTLLFWKH